MNHNQESNSNKNIIQLTTFYVGKELFGIEVMKIQEVTGNPNIVTLPLSPFFIRGLVNLRGQIATAIGLKELFNPIQNKNIIEEVKTNLHENEEMTVVCKVEGSLISFVVDSIGDVVEVVNSNFEKTPDTVPPHIGKFVKGIFKMDGVLLSLLDIETIFKELSPHNESTNNRT
jgi:purine-binding chemotaxis protein CheW